MNNAIQNFRNVKRIFIVTVIQRDTNGCKPRPVSNYVIQEVIDIGARKII